MTARSIDGLSNPPMSPLIADLFTESQDRGQSFQRTFDDGIVHVYMSNNTWRYSCHDMGGRRYHHETLRSAKGTNPSRSVTLRMLGAIRGTKTLTGAGFYRV